jgi:DNA-binding MarR family transcriptional regulator
LGAGTDDGRIDPLTEASRQWDVHGLAEPMPMHAATSIIHAQQVVATAIDRALRPLGLTFARYEVLMLLSFSRTGSLPITKIGERLLVHPTGITKLVDKLESQELVAREPNPSDRRGTLVRITGDGRRLGKRASKVLADVRFGVDLDDDKLAALIDLRVEVRAANDPDGTAGADARVLDPDD